MYVNPNPMKRLNDNDTMNGAIAAAAAINITEPTESEPMSADVELATTDEFTDHLQDELESIARVDTDEHLADDDDDNVIENDDEDVIEFINDTPSARIDKPIEQPKTRSKPHKNATESTSSEVANKEARNFKEDSSVSGVETVGEKRTKGLKVLSNVQVSPNAILNVSLNATNSDTIPLNNMIIVGSIPSTSASVTASPTVIPTNLVRSQSLLKSLQESRSSDPKTPKHTKVNVDVSMR